MLGPPSPPSILAAAITAANRRRHRGRQSRRRRRGRRAIAAITALPRRREPPLDLDALFRTRGACAPNRPNRSNRPLVRHSPPACVCRRRRRVARAERFASARKTRRTGCCCCPPAAPFDLSLTRPRSRTSAAGSDVGESAPTRARVSYVSSLPSSSRSLLPPRLRLRSGSVAHVCVCALESSWQRYCQTDCV